MANERETMRQGSDYREEGDNPEPQETQERPRQRVEVLSSSAEPKIPVKLLAILGGAIVVIVLGYFGYGYFFGEDEEEVEETAEDSIVDEFEEELIFTFQYTEEEWTQLREAGFSDTEIVQYEENQADPIQLVEQAKSAIDEQIRNRYAELKEESRIKGSPEYNALLDKTWLGLTPVELKGNIEEGYDTYFVKENVSFVKMGVRGHQPIIRMTSHDYGTLFHMLDHVTYMQLRDSGNIVATFSVTNVNGNLIVSGIETEIVDSIPKID